MPLIISCWDMGDQERATVGTVALSTRTRFPGGWEGAMPLDSSCPDIIPDTWGSMALWAGVKKFHSGHSRHGRIGKGSGYPSKGYPNDSAPLSGTLVVT